MDINFVYARNGNNPQIVLSRTAHMIGTVFFLYAVPATWTTNHIDHFLILLA